MTIEIRKRKGPAVEGRYAVTYVPMEPQGLKEMEFPLTLSGNDAEGMLHALDRLAQEQEDINELVRTVAGEEGLQKDEDYTPEGCLPFKPLLQALVGGDRLHQVEWGDADTDITKLPKGIEVNDSGTRFFFPYGHPFAQLFIEAVGEGVWDDEPMHSSSYLHEWRHRGEHDIAGILEPYKTLWVDSAVYPLLCSHLCEICRRAEEALGEKLFRWEEGEGGGPFLMEVIRKNLEMDRA